MTKLLVIGGGGREHALAWKLAGDSCRPEVFCAPGNAGTAAVATNLDIGAEDLPALVEWARRNRPALVVVGPEAPLCAGLTDRLQAEGLAVFGPTRDGAEIEGSKVFSKDVMEAAGVPTAAARTFEAAGPALAYVRKHGPPVVVKAEGLAAGKGVAVCQTVAEAEAAVRLTLVDRAFGDAGRRVIVEDFLEGEEASILALTDGQTIVPLAASQDHKRIFDGDRGPNTGGMGAYSPAPVVTDALWPVIRETVLEPTMRELRRRGIVYRGVLYAGLMIHKGALQVLEFNCRFGDPETQVVLPRLAGDLLPVLRACATGGLAESMLAWKPQACVTVVMASGGYPGDYVKGKVIEGLDRAAALPDVQVFHAGTRLQDGRVVTAGGRVLNVTALGGTLEAAVKRAYEAAAHIRFEGAQYRTDIAARALARR
jgi:phosphoribosylamine--glycine ligase